MRSQAMIALCLSVLSLGLNSVLLVNRIAKLVHSYRLMVKGNDRDDEGNDADDNGSNRCAGLDDIK